MEGGGSGGGRTKPTLTADLNNVAKAWEARTGSPKKREHQASNQETITETLPDDNLSNEDSVRHHYGAYHHYCRWWVWMVEMGYQ